MGRRYFRPSSPLRFFAALKAASPDQTRLQSFGQNRTHIEAMQQMWRDEAT